METFIPVSRRNSTQRRRQFVNPEYSAGLKGIGFNLPHCSLSLAGLDQRKGKYKGSDKTEERAQEQGKPTG
jgi:hypothetical protein